MYIVRINETDSVYSLESNFNSYLCDFTVIVLSFKDSFLLQFNTYFQNFLMPAKVNIIRREIAQDLMIPLIALPTDELRETHSPSLQSQQCSDVWLRNNLVVMNKLTAKSTRTQTINITSLFRLFCDINLHLRPLFAKGRFDYANQKCYAWHPQTQSTLNLFPWNCFNIPESSTLLGQLIQGLLEAG